MQTEKRTTVAEARAHLQGLTRETEMRQRRLAAIERERASWVSRAKNADAQIATLDARLSETETEIASIKDAPDDFALRRRSLLSEVSKAEESQKKRAMRLPPRNGPRWKPTLPPSLRWKG